MLKQEAESADHATEEMSSPLLPKLKILVQMKHGHDK